MPPKNRKNNQSSTLPVKQRVINAMIRRTKLNNFTMTQIIRGSTPDLKSSVVTGAAYAFFLNYPTYFRADSGSIGQMQNVPSLVANEQKVFDEYKVVELRLWYIPLLHTSVPLASYTTAAGNSGVTQVAPSWDPSLLVGLDLDDSANFTSLSKALNVQGSGVVKMRSGDQVVKLIDFPQVDNIDAMKWLNFGNLVPSVSSPPDPNNPAKLSTIKVNTGIALPSLAYPITNTTVGAFVAEWVTILRGSYTLS